MILSEGLAWELRLFRQSLQQEAMPSCASVGVSPITHLSNYGYNMSGRRGDGAAR